MTNEQKVIEAARALLKRIEHIPSAGFERGEDHPEREALRTALADLDVAPASTRKWGVYSTAERGLWRLIEQLESVHPTEQSALEAAKHQAPLLPSRLFKVREMGS